MIDPTTVFNQWIIFSDKRYELVDTIDIEINCSWIKFEHSQHLEMLMNNKEIGNSVLSQIKEMKLDKEYDAFTIIHISSFENKLSVGLDCFKEIK